MKLKPHGVVAIIGHALGGRTGFWDGLTHFCAGTGISTTTKAQADACPVACSKKPRADRFLNGSKIATDFLKPHLDRWRAKLGGYRFFIRVRHA
jgi:hypothetical protein